MKLKKFALVITVGLLGVGLSNSSLADSRNNNDWLYNELYRNQYHYSAANNWLNDPNGLLYDDTTGIYHMFYQYNPYGNAWGNMSWGHATSTDMVNWSELEVAIPELENQEWTDFTYTNTTGNLAQYGEVRYVGQPTTNWGDGGSNGKKYIFSGSAILDKKNESGLGENTILAFYTSCYQVATRKNDGEDNGWGTWIGMSEIQEQHLAYSTDGGKTFQQYSPDGNSEQPQPIIPVTQMPHGDAKDFRDPKVVYDEKNEQWIMIVVAGQEAQIFKSTNLLDWEYASSVIRELDVGVGVWECPELIPMTVEGTDEVKWVLSMSVQQNAYASGSGMQYMIGDLNADGVWVPESEQTIKNPIWSDFGEDLYAGVTFSNVPDNRKIVLAWMSNWSYTSEQQTTPWYSHMTVPRELKLIKKDGYHDGYALIQRPIEELDELEATSIEPTTESGLELSSEEAKVTNFKGTNYKIEADFSWNDMDKPDYVGMYVRASDDLSRKIYVGYDLKNELAYVNRLSTGEPNIGGPTRDKMNVHVGSESKKIKLTAYVDESSIEVFVNDGEYTITQTFYFRPEIIGNIKTDNVAFYAENGTVTVNNAKITPLRSIFGEIKSDSSQINLETGTTFNPLTDLTFTSTNGLGETSTISDSGLSVLSNTVNSSVAGNYAVTVGVKNSFGKYQEETIPVVISDKTTPDIDSIKLSVESLKVVKKGKSFIVNATTLPEGSTGTLSWTSDKPSVATVDKDGSVTAISEGISRIAVTSTNGKTASFVLRVTK